MYAHCTLQVKVDGILGLPFTSDMGVKQGDPLSPLLFGLYMDRFADFVGSRMVHPTVCVGNRPLRCILYADDLVLLAHDGQTLQMLLNVLNEFCDAMRMTVNTQKTEIVVFNKRYLHGANMTWKLGGRCIQVSKSFVYLGVVFHSRGSGVSAQKALNRRMDKARGALFAKMGICHGLKVFDVQVLNKLFDAVVVPCLMFGAEIWGPEILAARPEMDVLQCPKFEHFHAIFMRMALWVKKSTSIECMRSEMNRVPLASTCIEQIFRFHSKLDNLEDGNWLHACFLENRRLGAGSWVDKVDALLSLFTPGQEVGSVMDMAACKTGLGIVHERWLQRGIQQCEMAVADVHVGSQVRACPDTVREGFKMFKYRKWMLSKVKNLHSPIWFFNEPSNIRVLAQFRCISHKLECETRRSRGGRSSRLCQFCEKGEVEDELHVLFCEAWAVFRLRFPAFFTSAEFLELCDAVHHNKDVDCCLNKALNLPSAEKCDALVGFLKCVWKNRRLLTTM
jgi:hypothetical protein